jgi:hypothetical protein
MLAAQQRQLLQGLTAVTVLLLYISSADVSVLYRRPSVLWLMFRYLYIGFREP